MNAQQRSGHVAPEPGVQTAAAAASARRRRHAKIVATLGPSSSTREQIRALFLAGVDVFRLNFSHGTHEQHQQRLALIRDIEREVGRPIGVLGPPSIHRQAWHQREVKLKSSKAVTLSDFVQSPTEPVPPM